MKHKILLLLLLLILGPCFAKQYYIDNLESDIYINIDGSMRVYEKLSYVFESGSFRYISRDVSAPRDGFNLLEEVKVDGQVIPFHDNSEEIEYRRSPHLKVKYHFDAISKAKKEFELTYFVGNALKINHDQAILDWRIFRNKKNNIVRNGIVRVHIPEGIDFDEIVSYCNSEDGVTTIERDSTVTFTFNDYKKKSLSIEIHMPAKYFKTVKYPMPISLMKMYQIDPDMRRYSKQYFNVLYFLLAYLAFIIYYISRHAYIRSKSMPEITNLPNNEHPSLVARLLLLGSNEINLIPVLMQMAIKKIITFTQMEKANGKKIKNYWIDINEDASNIDVFDKVYLEALKKEGARKNKRIELKALINSSSRYKKEITAVIKAEFDKRAYIDPQKKKSFNIALTIFFLLLFSLVASLIAGLAMFSPDRLLAPLPALIIAFAWITSFLYLDEYKILTPAGQAEWSSWKAYKKYISKKINNKKSDLSPENAEKIFPYLLLMGLGQPYFNYFKKKGVTLDFPNLGEIAQDMEAINALLTVVVVTNISATSGGVSGGGGGGTGAG